MLNACALISGCDEQPAVEYVADVDASQLLQLTAVQGGCAWPGRVCYLTSWFGEVGRGCWNREGTHIRARFQDQEDRWVPAVEFRPVGNATKSEASLE